MHGDLTSSFCFVVCAALCVCAAGFMAQLIDLEKKERGAITIDLKLYKDHRFDDVDAYCL